MKMNKTEADELIRQVEKQALKRINKTVSNGFAEGKNYGIMLMCEITKELIEKRVEE